MSFRGTCCAPGRARPGGRMTTPKPAGCSICRSGWGTGSASMRFSPSCPPKAIMPRPTTGRSCAPLPFLRPRAQRSCWSGLSGVTLRPVLAPAAICCCAASWRRWATGDLEQIAAALIDALPGDPTRREEVGTWTRPTPVTPGFVVDLLTATSRIDAGLAARGIEHLLAWPKTYEPDDVLIPAARAFAKQVES